VVASVDLEVGEEQCIGGELIDIEAGSNGGRTRRSLTRWPSKRRWTTSASEMVFAVVQQLDSRMETQVVRNINKLLMKFRQM
jgi:predicted oxidoreductase